MARKAKRTDEPEIDAKILQASQEKVTPIREIANSDGTLGYEIITEMMEKPKEAEPSPFWQGIRQRLGKTNRTCPKCGLETFLVVWSKEKADGAVYRERRCDQCGHIEKRIAPAEKPAKD